VKAFTDKNIPELDSVDTVNPPIREIEILDIDEHHMVKAVVLSNGIEVEIPLKYVYTNFCRFTDRSKRNVSVQQIAEYLQQTMLEDKHSAEKEHNSV
jgi:hypothetical protein